MSKNNRIPIFNNSRMKLFSNTTPPTERLKIFSHESEEYNVGGMTLKKVKCKDCGFEMETAANVSQILCPHCGGKRFNLVTIPKSPAQTVEPVEDIKRGSLFQRDSELESKLKTYSGKVIDKDLFEKEFSNFEDLLENGFASNGDNGVRISDTAYQIEKLFSKLTITVTKELDLDSDIMEGLINKEDIISNLEEKETLPEKSIVIIKKAHGLMPPFESNFSELVEEDPGQTWVKDSNIVPDLKVEYSNNSFGIKQFMDILNERYDDAPDNIIELLTANGAIRIDGNQITINK